MKCDDAKERLPLFLYGELSFQDEEDFESHLGQCSACRLQLERERALHLAFDSIELSPPPGMAAQSRRALMAGLAAEQRRQNSWQRLADRWGLRWKFVHPALQPIGALALLMLGFFGSRVVPAGFVGSSMSGPVASRVRSVEPAGAGEVRVVIEDASQHEVRGRADDEKIQKLLMAGVQDPSDPGLRVVSVGFLMNQISSPDVRHLLLERILHDENDGVRLKALEGLKNSLGDPETRGVLAQVLRTDKNPGVRTQVIDLLIQSQSTQIVGLLQDTMRSDDNGYVKFRCQKVLHDMNASEGTF
jgi:hypothetical protein